MGKCANIQAQTSASMNISQEYIYIKYPDQNVIWQKGELECGQAQLTFFSSIFPSSAMATKRWKNCFLNHFPVQCRNLFIVVWGRDKHIPAEMLICPIFMVLKRDNYFQYEGT